ncbi:MAG TPA: PAS domain-containing protein [Segetibacter sp.]|nr:PAS domain-containing protein [Segetibacter sp.]
MNTSAFFNPYYNNAKLNSILIMDCTGVIFDVNQAFTTNFGYSKNDLKGQNFNILFNEFDRKKKLPELELETVTASGQAQDENYVVDKEGLEVWALGESLLVSNEEGENYIVKDIINLQAKKQLQLFLNETEELLERIFESTKDLSIMILDSRMKIIKANRAFLHLFEISDAPLEGSRLSDLNHPFWRNDEIKNEIRNIIINNQPLRHREFLLETRRGIKKKVKFDSQIIESKTDMGRKIFIMIEDVN